MHDYVRSAMSEVLRNLKRPPQHLLYISGPRQTGKTTLVQQMLERIGRPHLYLSADDPSYPLTLTAPQDEMDASEAEYREEWAASLTPPTLSRAAGREWLVKVWQQAHAMAAQSERGFILVLDEIQKIPNWSEVIKGLWDSDRRHGHVMHVILLGSAPLHMQTGLSESLMGRYMPIPITHWSYPEMSDAFGYSLDEYIYFGGYPGPSSYIHENDDWQAYMSNSIIDASIKRDILAMRRVAKPGLFRQLFELGCSQSGQITSHNSLLGQLQDAGNVTTLAHYLDLTAQAGLLIALQKYACGTIRKRTSIPKLNVLNTALISALSGYTFEQALNDRSFWGHMVESAVGAHLYNTKSLRSQLYYWREQNDEVDFVLESGPRLIAFEVKSGARRRSISGLEKFQQQHETAEPIVVGTGGIPLEEFLSTPASEWS